MDMRIEINKGRYQCVLKIDNERKKEATTERKDNK